MSLFVTHWKESFELRYWKQRKKHEGLLLNTHYEFFYTAFFGLDRSFYEGKTILDIGCGPRGSLEWATMTSRRVGLDPLASQYMRLGADRHQMEYLCSPSECIPMEDSECDVVFSFNSLDHVADVEKSMSEVKRVTRPGGLFLLLVEVNHSPTLCEPHELTPTEVIDLLKPEFRCEDTRVYAASAKGMYDSIRAGRLLPDDTKETGYMSARFLRTESQL